MAQKYLDAADPVEQGAKAAAMHLWQCYQSLSETGAMYRKDVFYQSSKAFAAQYYALFLAVGDGVSWRVKPKMHLFLELCCGMWKKLSALSLHGFNMFGIKNDPPRFV